MTTHTVRSPNSACIHGTIAAHGKWHAVAAPTEHMSIICSPLPCSCFYPPLQFFFLALPCTTVVSFFQFVCRLYVSFCRLSACGVVSRLSSMRFRSMVCIFFKKIPVMIINIFQRQQHATQFLHGIITEDSAGATGAAAERPSAQPPRERRSLPTDRPRHTRASHRNGPLTQPHRHSYITHEPTAHSMVSSSK